MAPSSRPSRPKRPTNAWSVIMYLSMNRKARFPILWLLFGHPLVVAWMFLGLHVHAQLTRGFISGTVTDPNGRVVVGAKVRIHNTATNDEREMLTNGSGVYRFVAIEPGVYTAEFSSVGFEKKVLRGIRVGPAEEVVLNEALVISGGALTIEVRATPPIAGLAKASPTIGTILDPAFIQRIPLSPARDATRLAFLTPTVVRGPSHTEISAYGQRTRQNNFLIDGVDNNDLFATVASARVIPEAIAEFQVQSSPFSTEYGRNTGAQVSILTRRGSNTYHGEIWDYYSGNWLEPVSLRNKRAGLNETPRFVQNEAGAGIGGPIRRDHTFFFGLLEADRHRESADARNAQPAVIPTPAGYAALANVPLGSGQTPESRQAVLKALAFLPEIHQSVNRYENLTTQSVDGIPVEVGTMLIPLSNPRDLWYGLGRLDHRLTESDNLTYRFLVDKGFFSDVADNRQFGSRFAAASDFLHQNHALSLTHAFSPSLMNEFRFAYSRSNIAFPENDPTSSTVLIPGAFTIGGTSSFPQGRISNLFQWQNVITFLQGRHSLKFGADIRRNRFFNLSAFDSKGTWFFNSLEDFLNNRAFGLRQSVTDSSFDARQTNQFYFFQDDFKLTQNLNLNLGLRYEYSSIPLGFFGSANAEIAAAGVPLNARPDRNNIAPRFGIAYSPASRRGWRNWLFGDGVTVLRAGFGIGYDILFYNILANTATNYPRVVNSDAFQPQTINLFPTLAPKQAMIPPFSPTLTFVNVPTDIQNPTNHFWSVSIQRQFGQNYLAEIGYAGSRSYHLLRATDRNPGILSEEMANTVIDGGSIPSLQERRVNPVWGQRVIIESTALSEYHALFLRVEKKVANGLLFGANYTWSANFSDNDEPLQIQDIVLSSPQVSQDLFDYRNDWSRSVFDRPHRFVVYYSYEMPWFQSRSRAWSIAERVFSNWRISGVTEWQSGQPFTIRTGVDSGGSGIPIAWRPDYDPDGIFERDPVEGNLRTFKSPISGEGVFLTPLTSGGLPLANSMPHGGNLGRNTYRGPSFVNWNLSLMKNIPLSERVGLQLRADWFNLWNHRNFGNPVATMSSAAFGANTTDPGGGERLLSLKILF